MIVNKGSDWALMQLEGDRRYKEIYKCVFKYAFIALNFYYISVINNIFECPAPKASNSKQKYKNRNTRKMAASPAIPIRNI